jgi:uncharacterized protein with PIN domain
MSTDNEGLKARMMAEAEEAIDKLLAGRSEKQDLQLRDIERLVREAGQSVMGRFTAELVEGEEEAEERGVCPECGGQARYKGRKVRDVVTETGEVRLERAYYYCPTCRKGFFPPRPPLAPE